MEKGFLSIEGFNTLLNEWEGQYVKVAKYEKNDHDETHLKLNKISYSKKTRRIDDYESMHTLQLNGSGKVRISVNEFEPLPHSLYEIPLEDNTQYKYDGNRLAINTDRAVYTIEMATDSEL